jgi:biopolymer transport protein TolR
MARARVRRRMMSEINVVPYIDVMLVLLIIFMITAPLLAAGVKVELPQADAEPLPQDSDLEPVVLTVDAEGRYFLNIGANPEAALTTQEVQVQVAAILRHRPGTPVVVRGDRAVEYRYVIGGMVLLQAAGAPSVGLMTEQPERPAGSGRR